MLGATRELDEVRRLGRRAHIRRQGFSPVVVEVFDKQSFSVNFYAFYRTGPISLAFRQAFETALDKLQLRLESLALEEAALESDCSR